VLANEVSDIATGPAQEADELTLSLVRKQSRDRNVAMVAMFLQ